jgi:hypothetical protein
VAFVILALIALVATAGAIRLHPDAGSSVRTRNAANPRSMPDATARRR